jgi:hypothetical protein
MPRVSKPIQARLSVTRSADEHTVFVRADLHFSTSIQISSDILQERGAAADEVLVACFDHLERHIADVLKEDTTKGYTKDDLSKARTALLRQPCSLEHVANIETLFKAATEPPQIAFVNREDAKEKIKEWHTLPDVGKMSPEEKARLLRALQDEPSDG